MRVLHCGDFRAHPSHLEIPQLAAPLDYVYLDTTYLNPAYPFPPQPPVLSAISEFCRLVCVEGKNPQTIKAEHATNGNKIIKYLNPSSIMMNWIKKKEEKLRTLVLVGSYKIGKEKVYMGISLFFEYDELLMQ